MKTFVAAATAILALTTTAAHALNARTWISGKGVDQAGCGPIATPCRTLQYGHDQTNAGGEIDVLDSAGYGALVITKAITIIGDGVIAGVLAQPGGVAIDINAAASDAVILRSLTVEGQGSGINGIRFNSGASITIANCVVQNFVGSGLTDGIGILLQPESGTSSISVSNTTVSYNGFAGIAVRPTGSGSADARIDKVVANNSVRGVVINATVTTGAATGTVTGSVGSANSTFAFSAQGATGKMMIDDSVASGNVSGFQASNGGIVYVGRSTATGNTFGFAGNSTIFTYQTNQIDLNDTDVGGGLTLTNATPR